MTTNFPSSIDNFTNPTTSDTLASVSHSAQHADINDAMEAVQAKVGVNGSAVTGSLDYKLANIGTWQDWTPTISQPGSIAKTISNARYTQINNLIVAYSQMSVTGTGTTANPVTISLPLPSLKTTQNVGNGGIFDSSTNTMYHFWMYPNSTTTVWLVGDWAGNGVWGTNPSIGLGNGDSFYFFMTYEAA